MLKSKRSSQPSSGGGGGGGSRFKLNFLSQLGGGGSSGSKNITSGKPQKSSSHQNKKHHHVSSGTLCYDSDIGDSCTSSEVDGSQPVLLAVRKRSCSDSGHDSTAECSSSSQNASPVLPSAAGCGPRKSSSISSNAAPGPQVAPPSSSKSSGGFFRLFHRSATLLFQHPTHELNHNKPYKGSLSISTKELRSDNHPILGKSKNKNNHQRSRVLSASSSSSLNSSVLHHHLENVDERARTLHLDEVETVRQFQKRIPAVQDDSSNSDDTSSSPPPPASSSSSSSSSAASGSGARGSRKSRPNPHLHRLPHQRGVHHHQALHSSSNSVISSIDSSNYDSGAFSRTSTPELSHQFQRLQQQIYQHNLQLSNAKSSLTLASPLNAPKLVMQACKMGSQSDGEDSEESRDSVDAKFILNCLNAASMPSTFQQQQLHHHQLMHPSRNLQSLNLNSDVSITIGTNTKLTITPNVKNSVMSPASNLRRSRSGLPVLGTAGLNNSYVDASTSPMKPARTSRSKISTVYLASPGSLPRTGSTHAIHRERDLAMRGLNRSESSVTLTNTSTSNNCDPKCCSERVTVNGQHHCGALNGHHPKPQNPQQQHQLKSSPSSHQQQEQQQQEQAAPLLKLLPGTSVDPLLADSASESSSGDQTITQPSSLINI